MHRTLGYGLRWSGEWGTGNVRAMREPGFQFPVPYSPFPDLQANARVRPPSTAMLTPLT